MNKEDITITFTYQEFTLLVSVFNKGITKIGEEEPYNKLRIKKANDLYDKFIDIDYEIYCREESKNE